jgi:hypothetical protein
MRFFSWIASCLTSLFEKKIHLSDEVFKTIKQQKDPDEGKDLVIGHPFFHESQIYPPNNYL